MPVSNEKANHFLNVIYRYAEDQRNRIQEESERFRAEELEKAEKEVARDVNALFQKETAQTHLKISRFLSREELASRKELLEKRQQITNEVFQKAAARLMDFTKTEDYPVKLEQSASRIAAVLTEPGTVLYLRREDQPFAQRIQSAFGKECSVEYDGAIHIGGIRGSNAAMGLIADETFDSKLEQQREWFVEHCGMQVV